MRLWHYKLIPFLPKSQLLAQWRELNSIFKKQDKHILINYVYDYSKIALCCYCYHVIDEMAKRGYKIKSYKNQLEYFQKADENNKLKIKYKFEEHDDEYLTICYWNLREKYIRGQKDFTKEIWDKLDEFYKKEIGGKNEK